MSKIVKPRRACCPQYESKPQEVTVLNEPNKKKYSRINCAYCGHWLRWGMSPKTAEQIASRKHVIQVLLENDVYRLEPAEFEFLTGIKAQNYLTPKQHYRYSQIFNRIMTNLGRITEPMVTDAVEPAVTEIAN